MAKARWQETGRPEARSATKKQSTKGRWKWYGEGHNGLFRLFLGLFALGAVLTIVVVLFWYLYPIAPPRLVVIHATYQGPLLAPNTFADRDVQALASSQEVLETHYATTQSMTAEAIRDQLAQMPDFPAWQRWLRWKKNTLLVYVNAFGVSLWDPAHKQTQPYLLGSDFRIPTRMGAPEQFGAVPFKEVLDAVVACQADKKILVLDCQRLDHHWPMGVLQNDFVTKAQIEINSLDKEKNRDLFVLFSCSAGQRTHYDPEFGLSPFARFFLEGLTGAGDLAVNGGNNDGRVQIKEAADYARARVADWALKNRLEPQEPSTMEFSDDVASLPVAAVSATSIFAPVPLTSDPSQQDVANQLDEAWRSYYQLRAETPAPYVYAPRSWRYAEETLMRCERFLVAGQLAAAAQEAGNALSRIQRVAQSKSRLAVDGRGYSVAMSKFLSLSRAQATTAAADPMLASIQQLDSPADGAIPLPSPIAKTELADYEAVLRDISQDRGFDAAFARIDAQPSLQNALPVEILTARMVQKYFLGANPTAQQLDVARSLIHLSEIAEQAAAPLNIHAPLLHKWTRFEVERGDVARRWQSDLAFASNSSPIVTEHDGELPPPDDPIQHYNRAIAIGDVVTEAASLRQQLLADLPAFVHYALAVPTDVALHADLEGLLETTRKLNEQLGIDVDQASGETIDSAVESLRFLTAEAKAGWSKLNDRLVKSFQQLASTSGPASSAQEWDAIEAALYVPLAIHAEDAGKSSSARLRLLQRLRQPIQFLDDDQPAPREAAADAEDDAPSTPDLAYQARLAEKFIYLRNGRSVQIASIAPAEAGFELAQSWQQAYLWSLQETFATAEEDWLYQVETATRLFDGFIAQLIPSSCVSELNHRRLAEFFVWQAKRATEDFWAALQEDAEPYFAMTARQYLLQAAHYDPHGFLASEIQQLDAEIKLLRDVPKNVRIVAEPSQARLVEQLSIPVSFRVVYPEQAPEGVAALTVQAESSDVALAKTEQQSSRSDSQQTFILTRNARAAQTSLSASVLFRGHRSQSTISVELVDDEAGPSVAYINEKPLDAELSIRLAANPRSDANVLFVLDCSSSMDQNGRMAILQQVLRQFSDGVARHAMNVGVRVLGDQVVWTEQMPEKEADARVDSRLLLPIQPFEPDQFVQVVSRLTPTGSTPLFYALIEAQKDFANVKQGPKRIIVISDGADNWALVGRRPNVEDLREAYRDSDIEINTIGFQVGDQAFAQLEEIAAARGGVAVRATHADALFKYVTGLQGAVFYSIVGSGIRTEPKLLTTQEEPIRLPAGDYVVELRDYAGKPVQKGHPVRLAIGESHHLRYFRGVISYAPLESVAQVSDPASNVTLAVLAAERQEEQVRLRVALHKADQPSWRPDSVSLFLRPKGSDSVYPLQNLAANVPGYHVPVWEFVAEKWPAGVESATVEVQWNEASSSPAIPLQWGAQPVSGAIPEGVRVVYRGFESRTVLGDRMNSALVKIVFPAAERSAMSRWSLTFDKPIARAHQIVTQNVGVYTGLFVLDGETLPQMLQLHPPEPADPQRTLKLDVGVTVPVIP